jgi:quercetin dioxygenase-like cupin family protein
MLRKLIFTALMGVCLLVCQSPTGTAILANQADAKWAHDAGDPPGSESVFLRQDPSTGAMDLLVRYPAGHVFTPHWHSVNERIVLIEGRLALRQGTQDRFLDPGGFAFLPAREVQRLSCVSKSRCSFYVSWDGKLDNHPAN